MDDIAYQSVCVYRFGSCCPISVTQFDCFCHQSESLSYSPQLGLLRTALRAFISISADLWRQKPFPPSIQEANITLTILFFPLTNSFNFLRVCFATIDHFENHMWFRTSFKRDLGQIFTIYINKKITYGSHVDTLQCDRSQRETDGRPKGKQRDYKWIKSILRKSRSGREGTWKLQRKKRRMEIRKEEQ